MQRMKLLIVYLNMFRIIPVYCFARFSNSYLFIKSDVSRWIKECKLELRPNMLGFGYLLVFMKEYRTLFSHRLKKNSRILWIFSKVFFKGENTLHIFTDEIGEGLFIQHGFATVIAAKSIGANCWINQQVTIGFEGEKSPVIGNNVRITAGAKVIGGVKIDDNCVIGANAVVVKDLPRGAVAVGVPAKVIKYVESL